jgi:type IV secretory pathway VirB3-like protein
MGETCGTHGRWYFAVLASILGHRTWIREYGPARCKPVCPSPPPPVPVLPGPENVRLGSLLFGRLSDLLGPKLRPGLEAKFSFGISSGGPKGFLLAPCVCRVAFANPSCGLRACMYFVCMTRSQPVILGITLWVCYFMIVLFSLLWFINSLFVGMWLYLLAHYVSFHEVGAIYTCGTLCKSKYINWRRQNVTENKCLGIRRKKRKEGEK